VTGTDRSYGGRALSEPKRLVVLTDDNGADYFPFDYAESLVQGLAISEDGIERESKVVTRLLAWAALQSGQSADTRFEMSRHGAAVVLELAAGWAPV
jgi:hypothetical protein